MSEPLKEQIESVQPPQHLTVGRAALEFLEPQPPVPAQQALKAYENCRRQTKKDELIVQYLPLVHRIVSKIVSYLRPPLSREDLVSAGTVGLVKAAHDFDPSKDAEFKTYAYIRVRGAIIDELRNWSFTPTNVKKQFEQAQQISRQFLDRQGRMPSDEELAKELGVGTEKMYKMFEAARAKHFISLSGMDDESPILGETLAADCLRPERNIEQNEEIEKLTAAIGKLPEKQRQIIVLYYHKELTMKQIAETLEVTESRISQLHAGALFRLSAILKEKMRQ